MAGSYIDVKRILNSVKVEDEHIILEKPIEYKKYGRTIKVYQINWWYKWGTFSYNLGVFLTHYLNVCNNVSMPEKITDLEEFRKNVRLTITNQVHGKLAFLRLKKLLKHFVNISWAKKKFGIDDWTELFLYAYVYNVLGVKKNLLNAYALVLKVQ